MLSGPSEARALGIGMVFQHFSLFENLTVAENVALGLPPTESFTAMSERLEETARVYGLPLDPKREVWRLSVGERQRIEIVRALMQNPKLLILDEPTAVLTPQEADQLFVVLERLEGEGRAILYISHKLEEVKRLCDTATILRGGKKVATCDPRQETAASLARMMVGGEIGEVKAASGRSTTVPRLVDSQIVARTGRSARHASARDIARGEWRRDRRHRRRCRQRPGRIVRRAVRGTPVAGRRRGGHRRCCRGSAQCDRAPAHGRGLRAGRAARPRHRAAHEAVRERVAHRSRRQRHGQKRLHQQAGDAGARRPHDQNLRRAQGQARSGGGEPVGRQSAEIHRRPRNPARARRSRRQSADLGR